MYFNLYVWTEKKERASEKASRRMKGRLKQRRKERQKRNEMYIKTNKDRKKCNKETMGISKQETKDNKLKKCFPWQECAGHCLLSSPLLSSPHPLPLPLPCPSLVSISQRWCHLICHGAVPGPRVVFNHGNLRADRSLIRIVVVVQGCSVPFGGFSFCFFLFYLNALNLPQLWLPMCVCACMLVFVRASLLVPGCLLPCSRCTEMCVLCTKSFTLVCFSLAHAGCTVCMCSRLLYLFEGYFYVLLSFRTLTLFFFHPLSLSQTFFSVTFLFFLFYSFH